MKESILEERETPMETMHAFTWDEIKEMGGPVKFESHLDKIHLEQEARRMKRASVVESMERFIEDTMDDQYHDYMGNKKPKIEKEEKRRRDKFHRIKEGL